MHPAIKIGAKLKNKRGDEVEIIKTDLDNNEFPILGIVNNRFAESYTINGKAVYTCNDRNLDLPPVFDPTKPVQTRNGKPARIIYVGKIEGKKESIGAFIRHHDGYEFWTTYFENGQYLEDKQDGLDLINIPE